MFNITGDLIMSRSGIMLCYPFEEKRLDKWASTVIVQPKLDGDRCRAIFSELGNVTLLSSEENVINSVPHINAELESLGYKNIELDGELYRHTMNHDNIRSIVGRTKNIHKDYSEIEYHVFDIVNNSPQYDRVMQISDIIPDDMKYIKVVPYRAIYGISNIMTALDEYINDGYEGIIVRNIDNRYVRKRSTNIMKFKPRKSDYYVIVGYKEEVNKNGQPKGTLGALILSSGDNDTFDVGSGSFFTADNRRLLWKERDNLIDQVAHIKYQHLTPGRRVPRFPVLQEILKVC
ncbi:MAG: DNA ligase [Parcubacteria group bacterium ADurb.Bin216]|nr:MAG: DNA ligase [Parcubacteria group bacterium ADurb.Bin216]